MLDNLLHFYDEFSHQTNDSDVVVIKSIAANGRVGDIRRRLGQLSQAQRSYEEAIKRIDQLSETVRDSEAVRLESARIHNGLGIVLQEDRNWKHADKHHREAIALVDHDGASQNERFELARSSWSPGPGAEAGLPRRCCWCRLLHQPAMKQQSLGQLHDTVVVG